MEHVQIERYVGGFKKTIGPGDDSQRQQLDGYLVFPTEGTCGHCGAEGRSVRWFKGSVVCPACIITDLAEDLDNEQQNELREVAVEILNSHP